jgi:prophage DNA circulation protein
MSQDDLFSKLPPGSFDGITLPIVSVEYVIDSAHAIHKYPYRAGGDIEYTGREPVSGSFVCAFFNGVGQFSGNLTVNDLWPGAFTLLQRRVQEQRSGPLVIPTIGTIKQAKLKLHPRFDPEHRDGCFVTIDFIEDTGDQLLSASLPSAIGRASTGAAAADVAFRAMGIEPSIEGPDGTISDWTNAMGQIVNQIQTVQGQLALPFEQIASLVRQANEVLKTTFGLFNPENWQAVDALKSMVDALQDMVAEITTDRPLKTYVTGKRMSVVDVSIATGNSVDDIMALNVVDDFNSINENVSLLVFANL